MNLPKNAAADEKGDDVVIASDPGTGVSEKLLKHVGKLTVVVYSIPRFAGFVKI